LTSPPPTHTPLISTLARAAATHFLRPGSFPRTQMATLVGAAGYFNDVSDLLRAKLAARVS
jgi:hypothetical protein